MIIKPPKTMKDLFVSYAIGVGLGIIIALAILFFSPSNSSATFSSRVTICHATSSSTNPYNKITVDDDAVDGDGNSDHNRNGHQDGEDIIPPGSWDADGRNWDATSQAIYNNDCNIPSPTPTPTVTVTPAPTRTPEPTPTIGPEPTATPSATPTPTAPSNTLNPSRDSVPQAPSCGDGAVTQLPMNPHVIRNGTTAEVKWVPTLGNQVNILYRENSSSGWTHAVRDEANDGYVKINHLIASIGYTFGVQQKNNCGAGSIAVIVDPPASKPTIFRLSYWIH